MSRFRFVTAAVVLVAVSVLTLTACGGGSSQLSKEDYTAKANKICGDVTKQADALPAPKSLTDIAPWLEKAKPLLKNELSDLRKLKPPADMESDVNAWLATGDRELQLFDEMGTAAKTGDTNAVLQVIQKGSSAASEGDKLAKKLGLTVCAASSA